MNKTQLVETIVASTGMKKKDVDVVITAFVASIEQALADG